MSKNKTGKRGVKIGKISSSHKGICVHTPSGKKFLLMKMAKQKLFGICKNKDLGGNSR